MADLTRFFRLTEDGGDKTIVTSTPGTKARFFQRTSAVIKKSFGRLARVSSGKPIIRDKRCLEMKRKSVCDKAREKVEMGNVSENKHLRVCFNCAGAWTRDYEIH